MESTKMPLVAPRSGDSKNRFLGCGIRNADKGTLLWERDSETWFFLKSWFQVREEEEFLFYSSFIGF
ncbi:hypothetical protein MRB53_029668 [Persea americana]|uniref:Uncharacterized protein n=1 Tax=Persea americana TaxID=3435 RepID=A0ACC2KJ10_PERAE|nr:hypothetical protein MRB53_029668 [Persea americana]